MKCQALTKAGFGCLHKAKEGIVMCGKHESKDHGQCIGLNKNGKRCSKIGTLCNKHKAEQQVIKDQQFAEMMWEHWMDEYDADIVTLDRVEMRIALLTEDGKLTVGWRDQLLERVRFERRQAEFFRQNQGQIPFYADNQNVHREVITDQTNRGMEILLAQEVPKEQETLTEIWLAWGDSPKALKEDMLRWYNQSSCRKENDWLYKRALDGLWSMIKGNSDLLGRLADEADESSGMCCEGHLCRLVNVMVGFDERFEVHVSKKEQLQQRMAEIAAMDVSTEQKALDAWKWMEANGIAEEERSAWIDAL